MQKTKLITKESVEHPIPENQGKKSKGATRLNSVTAVCCGLLIIVICVVCSLVLRKQLRHGSPPVQGERQEEGIKTGMDNSPEATTEQPEKTFEQCIIENHDFIEGALLTISSRYSSWTDNDSSSMSELSWMVAEACADMNAYMLCGDSISDDISKVKLGSNGNIGKIFSGDNVVSYTTGDDNKELIVKLNAFEQWFDFMGVSRNTDDFEHNLLVELSQIEGCYVEKDEIHLSADTVNEMNEDKWLSDVQYIKTGDGNVQVKYDVYLSDKIHSSDTVTVTPSGNSLGFVLQNRKIDLFQPKLAVMKSLLPMFKIFRPDILTGDAPLSNLTDEDIAQMVTFAFLQNYIYIQEPYYKNVHDPDTFFNGYVPILEEEDEDFIGVNDEKYMNEESYSNIIVSNEILTSCLTALGFEGSTGIIDELELDNYVMYYDGTDFVIVLNTETDTFYKLCPEDVSTENYDDRYEMGENGEIILNFGISHSLEEINDGIRYRAVFAPADTIFGYVLSDIGPEK